MHEPSQSASTVTFRNPNLARQQTGEDTTKKRAPSVSPSSSHTKPHNNPKNQSEDNESNSSAILDDDDYDDDDNDEGNKDENENENKHNPFSLISPPSGYEELAGPHDPHRPINQQQSFIIMRRPSRQFNTSKDNFLAQRALRNAGVDVVDWAQNQSLLNSAAANTTTFTTTTTTAGSSTSTKRRPSVHPHVIAELE